MENDFRHAIIYDMPKPELVLSNTTSFFIGGIEKTFQRAEKLGFKHLELVTYRWTDPSEILRWKEKYGINVAGIHLSQWWGKTLWQEFPNMHNMLEKIFVFVWAFYLGDAAKNPGLELAEKLPPSNPYLLVHTNVIADMGWETFEQLTKQFHAVIENLPYHEGYPQYFWNPVEMKRELEKRNLKAGIVFDHAHFQPTQKQFPNLDLLETYRQITPEVLHISYSNFGIHTLPNKKEQEELKTLLKIHAPRYIVLETNPLVSIKKGKKLLEEIISEALG